MSKERRAEGWVARFGAWMLAESPRWVATLFIVGALTLGLVVGALVATCFDVQWVEAAGTWFGAVATASALLIAYTVFRAEQRERGRDRALADLRERRSQAIQQDQQQVAADLVTGKVSWGMGNGPYDVDGVPTMLALHVRVTVTNFGPERAVDVRIRWVYNGHTFAAQRDQVDSGKSETHEWMDTQGVEVMLPQNAAEAALAAEPGLELSFLMFGTRWVRQGAGPVVRAAD